MSVTLAVLITYFNEKELLRQCLDSLFAQITHPDEVLIYDDASRFPAQDYIPSGATVQIVRSDLNRGTCYGRNLLLNISSSDYIHFHDTDDLFAPRWCQSVKQAIEDSKADVIFTEVSAFEGTKVLSERLLGLERLLSGEDLVRFCLGGAILPIATTIRREVAMQVRYHELISRQSEDFYYHIRLAASEVSYNVINEPLVFKRNRPDSQSHDSIIGVWVAAVEAIKLLSGEIPVQYQLDLAEAAARFGSILFKLGAISKAREAFKLADKLGPSTFRQQRKLYRLIAKTFGPEIAERIGVFYRSILPQRFREYLTKKADEIFI